MIRKTRVLATLAAALAIGLAQAQPYPNKPLHVYMPGAPGGSFDIMTRMVMLKMADALKQPAVVENIPGAGGTLSIDRCLKGEPDGYHLCVTYVGNLAIAPYLYPKLAYDPVKDLKPVALVGSVTYVLAVLASSPFKTMADLVAFAKANPGKLNYASGGNGTGGHVGGEIIKRTKGLDMVHVPYNGNAPASVALLSGVVDWAIEALPTSLPNVRAGKLRALAVTTPQRNPALPDVATMQEQGFEGFDLSSWVAISVPQGTPDAVVATLNTEINKVLASKELKESFSRIGAEPMGGTPEQFAAFLKSELAQYGKVMAKAKAD
ncbi:MAG: tripartite tricarboxylate transporter substrate binding protein [Usitatibacter sp.]